MALKKLPFKSLKSLIGIHLSTKEDLPTQRAIDELLPAKKRGYLNKNDLVLICRWKSPRAIRHIERNKEETIEKSPKRHSNQEANERNWLCSHNCTV